MTAISTSVIKLTDEAEKIANARDFYLRGAFQGALSTTVTENGKDCENGIEPTLSLSEKGEVIETWPEECNPEGNDPGEYINAEAMRQRYQHMSRDDLYDRVLALEGYIFGATGSEAPRYLEVSDYVSDLEEVDDL